MRRPTTAPPIIVGRSTIRFTPTIATSGALITGVVTTLYDISGASDGVGQATVRNCVRIWANLRDGRDVMAGVEAVRISIVLRDYLP